MKGYNENIVACYLYTITRYGYPPVAEDAMVHLDEFSKLGYTSIELEGIREEHLDGIYEQRYALKQKAETLGLKIPVFCTVLPGLSSPDEKERILNLERFKKGCEVAEVLGAKIVLDNSPLPPWKFPEGIPIARHYDDEVLSAASIPADLKWEMYWEALVETFREVCDIAAAKGLSYHLHPCHGALINSTDAYLLFAQEVKRDNLKFNLDTANQYFLKDNLFLSLLRLHEYIDYIHISDNRGHKVEHLAIGEGNIQWDRFFETLDSIGYKGIFGVDIGGAESDVADLDTAYRDAATWLEKRWF